MKKRIIIAVSILPIVLGSTAADAFNLKVPGFLKKALPAPVTGVLNKALRVPSSIVNGVAGKVSEDASRDIDKWAGEQTNKILGAMGIIDPVSAGKEAETSVAGDGLGSLASDVVSDKAQQGAAEQISQQVLSQTGQTARSKDLQATSEASQGVGSAASQGKGIPVTQKKLDALLDQNAQIARILESQAYTAQQNLQQNAAIGSGINQINKRASREDLAEIRESEAQANDMLNNSAYGSAIGTGRYY